MSGFAVVRHPDVTALGILPAGAFELARAQGWYRISEYRPEPSDFHLPEFADCFDDLDAPPPPPKPKPEPKPEPEPVTEPVDEDEEQQ